MAFNISLQTAHKMHTTCNSSLQAMDLLQVSKQSGSVARQLSSSMKSLIWGCKNKPTPLNPCRKWRSNLDLVFCFFCHSIVMLPGECLLCHFLVSSVRNKFKPWQWLGRISPKWPILCPVGH